MNFSTIKTWLAGLCVVALVGCGGGAASEAGTPVLGGSATPIASSIVLTLSANSVANNGSQAVTATALALDAKNNTVVGVPITISVDTGTVTPGGKVTDATGVVTGSVGIGSDQTTRTISVTATSGALSKTVPLQVVASTGGTGSSPSDILLTLSSLSISNDGSAPVTATVTALDAKRNVLPGVVVSFSVDRDATVAPSGTSTTEKGVLTAAVGIGSNSTNRVITVTASAGGLTRSTPLNVITAPVTSQPVAADLTLSLSASTITNSGSGAIVATVTAVDGNRNALAGIPVTFSVDGNAIAVPSGPKTIANGVVTASVSIGADRTNRVINITATSGSITRSLPVSVYGAKLFASVSPVVNVGSKKNDVLYKLVDFSGLPMAFQPISVISTDLGNAADITDINGAFKYTYDAPASAKAVSILASAAGSALTSNIDVVAIGTVPIANAVPQSASVTPSPSVVSVNAAGSTTNQVQLRALFVGENNLPIQNIRVRFDLNGNSNSTDGKTSYVGSFAYSDASGVSRGVFTPGQISSPTNGVTIRACWDLDDFAVGACPNPVVSTLTVASESLSVAIRTDNTISSGTSGLTYVKKYVVMVVDAAGQAKSGVVVTPSIDLPSYYKGRYFWNGINWQQQITLASTEVYQFNSVITAWVPQSPPVLKPSCPNEDINRNGVREATPYVGTASVPVLPLRGEDMNWNGAIDPRKADVTVSMSGSATTDASGLAIVQIEYGKSVASWVDFVITVTASGISGTESRATYAGLSYGVGNLPFIAEDVTKLTVPPAFVVSPYGTADLCTDSN